ncbi:MAG: ATP-grasp domain-containing protein, partial [Chlorobiaceae bacterium]|nr:ATP-grasp domain-containing protein [Chlorobiaceae bacterium]
MFRHIVTFHGPSPFALDPVVVAGIDLPPEESGEAAFFRQGCRCFHDAYPDWFSGQRSSDLPFAEYIAATLAQWAMGALNEVRGYIRESGYSEVPGGALLWVGFHEPQVSVIALDLAWNLLESVSMTGVFPRSSADEGLDSLWHHCSMHHPDYQARILMEGAFSKGVPVMPFIPGTKYWQFGWGSRSRIFFESMSNDDGSLGYQLQKSKPIGKEVFKALGFPSPAGEIVSRPEELAGAAKRIGWPCVVKPLESGGGRGVVAGIRNEKELTEAFAFAKKFTDGPVMVEKFVEGNDHRLMVIGGKFFAAIRREPSSVTGDGKSTIRQLVDGLNRFRSHNIVKSRYLRPVSLDDVLERFLISQGLDFDTVPEEGRRVYLRSNSNLSTGGICIDVSGSVHPDVKRMAESVAITMGLGTAGIDFITTDIGKSFHECGALIESNTTPGLDAMIAAGQNTAEVACAVLGSKPGRIPFHLIVVEESGLEDAWVYLKSMKFREGAGLVCGQRA